MSRTPILAAVTAAMALAACAPAAAPVAPAPEPAPRFPATPPEVGPAPALSLPAPVQRTLANGLEVLYIRHGSVPMVQATLITRGGISDDPANMPGLASFTAEMLDEGAGGRGALELAAALEILGANLRTGSGWDGAQINMQVLRGGFRRRSGSWRTSHTARISRRPRCAASAMSGSPSSRGAATRPA
jgi:zinc protease